MANIHYEVMVGCHDKLVTGIKQGADSLADALFQVGMLPESLRDDVYIEYQQIKKARQLVGFLEDNIKLYPSRFDDFMGILREKADLYPQFGTLVIQLEDKKAELLQEAQSLSGSNQTLTSEQTYISKLSVEDDSFYIRFECSCGECSFQEFLNGKNCPNSPPNPPPQLSLWSTQSSQRIQTQADMRYSEYKIVVVKRNRELQAMYRSLLSNTINELKAKHSLQTVKDQLKVLITPHGASKSLYPRMYTRSVKGHIRDLQTYDELQKYLENNFCSWFNISLIVSLRKVLLGYHGDPEVISYKEHMLQYLIRCMYKLEGLSTCIGGEHQPRPCTEILCSVFTDFTVVHDRQIREFVHQLRQVIALPECERKVDESGVLSFQVEQGDTEQTKIDDLPPGMNSRLSKALIILVLVIALGVTTTGSSITWYFFKKHITDYRTIALGSTRVQTGTLALLLYNITVSNFTSFDSFTFSTRSGGVADIYITDYKFYNKSISRQGTLDSSGITHFMITALGSNVTLQTETESGVYENCSTKLILLDNINREDEDKYTKKQLDKGALCITKPFQYHFATTHFAFEVQSSEKILYSLTGDIQGVIQYQIITRCSISNTSNCSIHSKWFASEATVCVMATTRDSDIPYSDIEYGIKKATVPLWKKIAYYFIGITLFGLGGIPGGLLGVVLCGPLGLGNYKICRILSCVWPFIVLVLFARGLYYDINFFLKICAL